MGTDEPGESSAGPNPFSDPRPTAGLRSLLRGAAPEVVEKKEEPDVEETPLHQRVELEDVHAQRTLVRMSLIGADVVIMVLLGAIVLGSDGGLSFAGAVGVVLTGMLAAWLGFLAYYIH